MKKKYFTLITILITSILLVTACGGNKEDHSKHDHGKQQGGEMSKNMSMEPIKQNYAQTELKVGDKTICPVMGTKFTVKENTKFVTIKDKKYYVCCPSCIEAIKKDSDKYLK